MKNWTTWLETEEYLGEELEKEKQKVVTSTSSDHGSQPSFGRSRSATPIWSDEPNKAALTLTEQPAKESHISISKFFNTGLCKTHPASASSSTTSAPNPPASQFKSATLRELQATLKAKGEQSGPISFFRVGHQSKSGRYSIQEAETLFARENYHYEQTPTSGESFRR